jgi:hypothetical protein
VTDLDSYDDTMPVASAEDLAALALHGRTFTRSIYVRTDFERAIVDRGPIFAQVDVNLSRYASERTKWAERRIIANGDTMYVTLDPDIFADSHGHASGHVDDLVNLGALEDCSMATFPRPQIEEDSRVASIVIADRQDGYASISITEKDGRRQTAVAVQNINFMQTLLEPERSSGIDGISSHILAHEQLHRHLFVTNNQILLNLRHTHRWSFSKIGIVTPIEALRIINSVLRGRNSYIPMLDAHSRFNVSEGLYYDYLIASHLPTALKAFRSCLAPNHRDAETRRELSGLDNDEISRPFGLRRRSGATISL